MKPKIFILLLLVVFFFASCAKTYYRENSRQEITHNVNNIFN